MQQPLATGRPPASASVFRSGPEHTFPATPLGRVAARRMLPELRTRGDMQRADRIEMWLLAAEITWRHPRTTHVRRVVGPDSVGVTAVELDGGRQVAAGSYSQDRPELIEQDRGPLDRLARIAGVQAGVFEQIEQPDEQSGLRLVSLADMQLLAAQLPVDEAATQRELAEIEDGVPIGSATVLRIRRAARVGLLHHWLHVLAGQAQRAAGRPIMPSTAAAGVI